ncbi:MAG: CBS domain-containing protein [Bacteroidetes bacterium]|nr:CBS domain-containing protein [Bacteroidota bacterium]
MLAKDLIADTIPPLKISDTGVKALSWMDEFKVRHLPVVNNIEYLGLISESDMLDLNSPDKLLGDLKLSLKRPFVTHDQHIYEVIKLIASLNLTLMPVLNDKQNFLGTIPLYHLFQSFANMASLTSTGSLIVLELNVNDYSLSEIGQIVESNDAKILSSYITSHSDSTKLELTLKINKTNISDVLQTFNRYNYTVTASYQQTEFVEDLKNRLEYLMNYINI